MSEVAENGKFNNVFYAKNIVRFTLLLFDKKYL